MKLLKICSNIDIKIIVNETSQVHSIIYEWMIMISRQLCPMKGLSIQAIFLHHFYFIFYFYFIYFIFYFIFKSKYRAVLAEVASDKSPVATFY